MYQINVLPKKLSLKGTQVLLNYYLVQFLVFFSTLPITYFTPFPVQSTIFSIPKNLYWTEISIQYPAVPLISFPVTLHLTALLGRVRKRLNVLVKFFGTLVLARSPVIIFLEYLLCSLPSLHFKYKTVISNFWCPYLHIRYVWCSQKNESNKNYFSFWITKGISSPMFFNKSSEI